MTASRSFVIRRLCRGGGIRETAVQVNIIVLHERVLCQSTRPREFCCCDTQTSRHPQGRRKAFRASADRPRSNPNVVGILCAHVHAHAHEASQNYPFFRCQPRKIFLISASIANCEPFPTSIKDDDANALCSIPLIDFSPFLLDDDDDHRLLERKRSVALQIDEVNRSHGFLALINFGITEEERTQAFCHVAELFALPDEYKRTTLPRIAPETNLGYAPLQSERLNRSRPPEMKEAFNVKFPPAWKNDYQHCPDPETFGRFWDNVWLPKFQALARRFAVACAMALHLDDDNFFAQTLEHFDLCTLRMLHYPTCDWEEAIAQKVHDPSTTKTALRIGEHTDFGMFTFLLTCPGPDGLQIKSMSGAEVGGAAAGEADGWHDVVLPTTVQTAQGSQQPVLIVNTGALLARWTNDEWKATAHRVIVPNAEVAGRSRYSIACFIDPDQDSMVQVHPSFAKEGNPIRYEPIKSSDYLSQKLQSMMKKA
eukprot:scaffold1323_cov160-Amphora_coffeaeformis.AAC.2